MDLQLFVDGCVGFCVRVLGREAPVQKQLPKSPAPLHEFPVDFVRNRVIDPGPNEQAAIDRQGLEPRDLIAQRPLFDDFEWCG
jgi:hypothetical protein